MWYKLSNACAFYGWEVEFHVRCKFLEFLQQRLLWCTKYIMDFVNLVKFIISWKEWEKRYNFEHDTAHSPQIHLIAVVAVCK